MPSRWKRRWQQAEAFHLRDLWWRVLDYFEASRGRRIALYGAVAGLLIAGATWYWAYPWWARESAIRVAQKWLDAGQLRYAAEAAEKAAQIAPTRPEPWTIAAELARRGRQYDKALLYAHRASELAPTDPALLLNLASAAVMAEKLPEAEAALARIPAAQLAQSGFAQRLLGEMARRQYRLTPARDYFEQALKLEGPLAVNEVPLALVLLQSTEATERQRGLDLLRKWSADAEWGATALRTLLQDALLRQDRSAQVQWAEALRRNPERTNADMQQCLQALATADEVRFAAMLEELQRDHAASPAAAAQLLSWLNQIGRSAEALRWLRTLPEDAQHRPPLIAAGAESLRLAGDWSALKRWTETGDWGTNTDFLRWVYGLLATRQLEDGARADELQRSLLSRAQVNGTHGLFAGSSLYAWGQADAALALWWKVSEQEGQLAIDALGSLARHFQVQRDAEGQYRVFRRLHALRPDDRAIGNNYAFFATLTGREQRAAARIARENLDQDPTNRIFQATYAFVLTQDGRAPEALTLLKARADEAKRDPALGFAYGMALARADRQSEAQALLEKLPPETLTLAEVALIQQYLGK